MIKQERFDQALQKVHQVIVPAHMSQFMSENGLDFGRKKAGEAGYRQKDHRPKPAQSRGDPDQGGLRQSHRPGQTQPLRGPAQAIFPFGLPERFSFPSQTPDLAPARRQP